MASNEQYLFWSYFIAVAAGLAAAVVTVLILAGANRLATAGPTAKRLATILRRIFPTWIILAVLLGFMSVSYFDCGHSSYDSIIKDRPHLVRTTHAQASAMPFYLAVAIIVYGFVLLLFLWARAKQIHRPEALHQ